jgi:hypothetical protein
MIAEVPRHATRDVETCRRYLQRELRLVDTVCGRLDSAPGEVWKLFNAGLSAASFASVVDPGSEELCRGLRIAKESALALVLMNATDPAAKVVVAVDGRERVFPATGPQEFGHAVQWQVCFDLAMMLRDRDTLDRLCAVPGDALRRSTTRMFELDHHIVEVMRALWLRRPDVADRLVVALEATDPADEPRSADWILNTVVPSLKVLAELLTRDAAAFRGALIEALELHRQRWSAPSRAGEESGWLAWQCLALASLAHDEGIPVEVESGYLPPRVYRGLCALP